jgi:hypothetical protein
MLSKFIKKIFFLSQIIFDNKLYYKLAKSQNKNKENLFLKKISSKLDFKYFIEIGFHNTEFNCLGLIEKNFSGLLIDSGRWINVFIMRLIIKILKKDIQVLHFHIEKKNVKKIFNNKKIGCLSIDIDGNDFWIVKKILELNIKPEVFIVEYNPSFLNFSYSSLYDKKFDRFKKHPSGFYHGASLISFVKLFKKYDFCLVKIIGGINAFFLQKRLLKKFRLKVLNSSNAYREGEIRNNFSKKDAKLQFDIIKKSNFAKI